MADPRQISARTIDASGDTDEKLNYNPLYITRQAVGAPKLEITVHNMALHGRYTNSLANDERVVITFSREDLLWKTTETLTAPGGQQVKGLPIRLPEYLVGPTILDMMLREEVPVTEKLREQYAIPEDLDDVAFWSTRPTSTLWPGQGRQKPAAKKSKSKLLDHPFQAGFASGGRFVRDEGDFVRVQKLSKISISALALKLAVGMTGGISSAYTKIATLASQAWNRDLERARTLWELVSSTDKLIEDSEIVELRPTSSVSQEIERLVMREACIWLGVDPDLDCSRPRGRPRGASTEAGKIVRMTVTADERLHGIMLADFYGIKAGTDLSELEEKPLVELLGALRIGQYEADAELVEVFLDVAAPGWRERAAAGTSESAAPGSAGDDPYEILDVPRDATLDDVTKAYRRAMQKVHPDTSALSRWFSQKVSEAYRTIRQERGEQ